MSELRESFFYRYFLLVITGFGSYVIFCSKLAREAVKPPYYLRLVLNQMEFVGVKSFWIIIMASIMIGAVFGIQFGHIFRIFGAESMIGAAASVALSKELAPVVGAFLVTGRAGSAMTAEIATMKVNEQVDAMKVMGINPISYLAVPRVIASMLMLPLLSSIFVLCGIVSAYLIGVMLFNIDQGVFMAKIKWVSKPEDIVQGLQKAVVFGGVYSSIACYKGFFTQRGAKGVGVATTQAVVIALVVILVSDFFISYMQMHDSF